MAVRVAEGAPPAAVFEAVTVETLTLLGADAASFLRYEPDSPVTGPLRTQPHVAYRVADVETAVQGHDVLLEPFDVGGGFVRVAFVDVDGAVVEFMQYANPSEEGWF